MKKLTALLMLLSLAAFTIGCAQEDQGAANGNGDAGGVEAPETTPVTPDSAEPAEPASPNGGLEEETPESDEPALPEEQPSEPEAENPEQ